MLNEDESSLTIITSPPGSSSPADPSPPEPPSTLGLGPLNQSQHLVVSRKSKPFHCNCEVDLKYDIHAGDSGEILYKATEKSNALQQCCLGSCRAVDITISDIAHRGVIQIERPLSCFGCCCSFLYPMCTAEFIVKVDNQFIGTVRERASWFYPVYHIFDEEGTQIFKVRGPGFVRWGPSVTVFNVTRHLVPSQGIVASIIKKWPPFCSQFPPFLTHYDISYTTRNTLSLNEKALVLASTFLIEATLYAEN
eukprot:TRINITY_DN6513_c0_g1_i1.p1 TRINITY_DN6513_c0_g1~~TRINITY_DN6513_c0_g1_i1.p1  ORF type:complete len:251 (+),score=25.05 TRINITY_DN6513_c0_g1_i1:221-973(+)